MIIKGKFAYFSIKTYVVDTQYNRLAEAILMCTHNIYFYGELTKNYPSIIIKYHICSTINCFFKALEE